MLFLILLLCDSCIARVTMIIIIHSRIKAMTSICFRFFFFLRHSNKVGTKLKKYSAIAYIILQFCVFNCNLQLQEWKKRTTCTYNCDNSYKTEYLSDFKRTRAWKLVAVVILLLNFYEHSHINTQFVLS